MTEKQAHDYRNYVQSMTLYRLVMTISTLIIIMTLTIAFTLAFGALIGFAVRAVASWVLSAIISVMGASVEAATVAGIATCLGWGVYAAYVALQITIGIGTLLTAGDLEKGIVNALNALTGGLFGLDKLGGQLYYYLFDLDYTLARLVVSAALPDAREMLWCDYEMHYYNEANWFVSNLFNWW
ncbi:MAG: hypothetical protein ACFFD4_21845 [Candidatus Odinarchaeota archaeon]